MMRDDYHFGHKTHVLSARSTHKILCIFIGSLFNDNLSCRVKRLHKRQARMLTDGYEQTIHLIPFRSPPVRGTAES